MHRNGPKDREPYPSYDQRYRRHLFGETGSAECRDRKSEDPLWLGTEVSHNALDDAVDLKNIIKHIDLEGCSEHMLQIMKKYTAEKEVYYRQRRFREKWKDVSEEIQKRRLVC